MGSAGLISTEEESGPAVKWPRMDDDVPSLYLALEFLNFDFDTFGKESHMEGCVRQAS